MILIVFVISLVRARVHDMPHFVYAGKGLKAVLTCPTDAEPRVNDVIWRKNGSVIDLNEVSYVAMYSDNCQRRCILSEAPTFKIYL